MLCQKCTKPRNHCGYRVLLSGGFNPDIFASEALHCNGLQISNKKYSQFF